MPSFEWIVELLEMQHMTRYDMMFNSIRHIHCTIQHLQVVHY